MNKYKALISNNAPILIEAEYVGYNIDNGSIQLFNKPQDKPIDIVAILPNTASVFRVGVDIEIDEISKSISILKSAVKDDSKFAEKFLNIFTIETK